MGKLPAIIAEEWPVAGIGLVRHLCQPIKKKHRHSCGEKISDIKPIYDKNSELTYLRCLCCNAKIKIDCFPEKERILIFRAYKSKNFY
ncbi:MAG: hypothetical protein AAB596_01035 [Patescibacteria group bacterium]